NSDEATGSTSGPAQSQGSEPNLSDPQVALAGGPLSEQARVVESGQSLPSWTGLLSRQQFLGPSQVDADEAADAFLDHGHAKQAVHAAHRHGIVCDDEVAGA